MTREEANNIKGEILRKDGSIHILKTVGIDGVVLIKDVLDIINNHIEESKGQEIPYLMHKKMGVPLSECQKAYDVAIDYLRNKAKLKG